MRWPSWNTTKRWGVRLLIPLLLVGVAVWGLMVGTSSPTSEKNPASQIASDLKKTSPASKTGGDKATQSALKNVAAELAELRQKVASGGKSISVTGVDQFLLNWTRPFAGIAFLGLALWFGWENKTVPMYVSFGIGLALLGLPYLSDSVLDGAWWAQASTKLFGTIQTHPWEWVGATAVVAGAVLLRGKKYLAGVSLLLVGALLLAQPPLPKEVRDVFKRVEDSKILSTVSVNPLPKTCDGKEVTVTLTDRKLPMPNCKFHLDPDEGSLQFENKGGQTFDLKADDVDPQWPKDFNADFVRGLPLAKVRFTFRPK